VARDETKEGRMKVSRSNHSWGIDVLDGEVLGEDGVEGVAVDGADVG
jgi:hypothetical protein